MAQKSKQERALAKAKAAPKSASKVFQAREDVIDLLEAEDESRAIDRPPKDH